MRNKTENLLRHCVTRRMENDVTQPSIQISANQFQLQCYSKCLNKWRPLVSTQQYRRLCHWSTASSNVDAETRESVVGYQTTRV